MHVPSVFELGQWQTGIDPYLAAAVALVRLAAKAVIVASTSSWTGPRTAFLHANQMDLAGGHGCVQLNTVDFLAEGIGIVCSCAHAPLGGNGLGGLLSATPLWDTRQGPASVQARQGSGMIRQSAPRIRESRQGSAGTGRRKGPPSPPKPVGAQKIAKQCHVKA